MPDKPPIPSIKKSPDAPKPVEVAQVSKKEAANEAIRTAALAKLKGALIFSKLYAREKPAERVNFIDKTVNKWNTTFTLAERMALKDTGNFMNVELHLDNNKISTYILGGMRIPLSFYLDDQAIFHPSETMASLNEAK